MKKYYCPITNEQFNQLIRFGQILVPQCLIVNHDDDFNLVQNNLVNTFVKYIKFKYDEEYLVLHVFAFLNKEENTLLMKIKNIEGVFPISDECYKAVTFKHPKIEFSKPIFTTDSLTKIDDAFFLSDSKNGIECLSAVFKNIFRNTEPEINGIIQAASKFRKKEKLSNLQIDSNLIDFVFLYSYQAYYPLTTLGYFYRTSEILTRKALIGKGKLYNQEILENTEIYRFLEEIRIGKPECNLPEIISILEKDDRATKFIARLSHEEVKYFIVIPMFLKIVDEFNDNKQNIEDTSLEKLIKHYGPLYKKECQQLILWLGAYLGYGNCYDYFYLMGNLKIFKSYKPIITKPKQNKKLKEEEQIHIDWLATDSIELISELPLAERRECDEIVINLQTVAFGRENNENGEIENKNNGIQFQEIILAILQEEGICTLKNLTKQFNKQTNQKVASVYDLITDLGELIESIFKNGKIEKVKLKSFTKKPTQLNIPL